MTVNCHRKDACFQDFNFDLFVGTSSFHSISKIKKKLVQSASSAMAVTVYKNSVTFPLYTDVTNTGL